MALRKKLLLPLGIHMNLDYVHMVQVEQADEQVHVVSKASHHFDPIPEADEEASGKRRDSFVEELREQRLEEARQWVRRTLASDGFRGKEAVISLPGEYLAIQHLRLSPMPPEDLSAALPWELQGKLPFDPRAAVIRHIVAGTVSENNETKQDVIALAAKRSVVEKHAGAMEKIGLQVVGVGVEPCTMCYPFAFSAMRSPPSQEGPSSLMLVHMTWRLMHVAIVRGSDLMFIKDVELGVADLVAALARARNLSTDEAKALRARWRETAEPDRGGIPQEAVEGYNSIREDMEHLVEELQSCMRYHASLARGAQVNRILFLGPEARDRALVRVLGAHLGTPCEVGDPLGSVTHASGTAEPELAVVLGLSLFQAQ